MAELGPQSRQELEEFCGELSENQAKFLNGIIERVCNDPSGRGNPGHSYTRKFQNPERYIGKKLPQGMTVWEFKPNQYRGLFIMQDARIAFLPVRGKRFMTVQECPWH